MQRARERGLNSSQEGRSVATEGRTKRHFGREHPIASPSLARKSERERGRRERSGRDWSHGIENLPVRNQPGHGAAAPRRRLEREAGDRADGGRRCVMRLRNGRAMTRGMRSLAAGNPEITMGSAKRLCRQPNEQRPDRKAAKDGTQRCLVQTHLGAT